MIAGFIILIALSYNLQGSGESAQPDYTVFSTNPRGLSLLYDTLREIGCPVRTDYRRLDEDSDDADICVIAQPLWYYMNEDAADDLLDWVYGGGCLIYLQTPYPTLLDDYFYDDYYGHLYDYEYGGFYIYEYGSGCFATSGADRFTNSALMEDSSAGAVIMEILDYMGESGVGVGFNLYYNGFDYGGNAWQQAPVAVKVVVYQIAVAAALLVLRLGKRFGRPVPYYEDQEREENEHVLALAAVYERAKVKVN